MCTFVYMYIINISTVLYIIHVHVSIHSSDRYMLLCSTRDDTSLRLIDLRQNAITSTFT